MDKQKIQRVLMRYEIELLEWSPIVNPTNIDPLSICLSLIVTFILPVTTDSTFRLFWLLSLPPMPVLPDKAACALSLNRLYRIPG